mmetsp:Transcript_1653/g.2517  ORF Transcript_1653/g.2517 Transcript_1653/m.2517 type:complete len:138 (+) Transcript_1653:3-416(+)
MSESLDGRQCSSMDEITRDSFLLHNDKTRYERKLQRCVLAFASTVTDECQSIADLNIFSEYVSENYQNVCSRADKFLVDVIKDRATQKSINQVVTTSKVTLDVSLKRPRFTENKNFKVPDRSRKTQRDEKRHTETNN